MCKAQFSVFLVWYKEIVLCDLSMKCSNKCFFPFFYYNFFTPGIGILAYYYFVFFIRDSDPDPVIFGPPDSDPDPVIFQRIRIRIRILPVTMDL